MKNVLRYSLIAWVAYAILWTWLISSFIEPWPAFIRVMTITIPEMVIFYLNLIVLIPRFLDGNSRMNYFGIIAAILAVSTLAGGFLDIYLDDLYPFHNFRV